MSEATMKAIGRKAIRIANSAVNIAVLMIFMLMLAFGGYALWDSNNVASSAEAKQYEIYKPSENPLSFHELQAINPEVFGWLTIYGTPIDYPLVQADDNSKYINTNAQGEYSLTGALFLHYMNDKSFTDFNSIIYGHNMVPSVMFGSIKDFKEKSFFDSHKYGSIYYDGKEHGLELFALIEADAYDATVFNAGVTGDEARQAYIDYLLKDAIFTRDVGVSIEDRIVLLSTCSTESTNGRDILIGRITEETYNDDFYTAEPLKEVMRIDSQNGQGMPLWVWLSAGALIALIATAVIYRIVSNRRRKGNRRDG